VSKLGLIALPLVLYGLWFSVAAIRKRLPSRRMINMHTSLLLMFYLLITAGLGIFWVANQQLPVFDWHYLFGYGTLLLVFLHLFFNLPPLIKTLRKRRKRPPGHSPPPRDEPKGAGWTMLLTFAALAFFAGKYVGSNDVVMPWTAEKSLPMGPIDAIVAYHEYSSESSEDVFPRAPSIDWTSSVTEFKTMPGPKTKLPPPSDGGGALNKRLAPQATKPGELSLQALADILFHAAGVTAVDGDYNLRAAPSSGALAPTEVYVQTPSVGPLCGGTYHYDPEHHQLAQMGACGEPDDTLFFVTSVFRRTGKKYEDRAYRYAVADAGHMLENLRLATAAYNLHAQPLTRFAEGLIHERLGLDGIEEGVLAVVRAQSTLAPLGGSGWRYPDAPSNTELGVTGVVHIATSLSKREEKGIPLPEPSITDAPLFDLIKKRRSDRRYSEAKVSLENLSALLAATQGPGPLLSRSVVWRFIANRVEGIEPGLYRYQPDTHAIVQERKGDLANDAYEVAFSQDVIGKASLVFIGSADRQTLFSDHGARGYRHAFLEVGMMSERLLLTATNLELHACPVGAFFDDGAAELIGSSMSQEWVLHFIGLGRP
jgi:SagB-type dehydrogenase family enzyme